MPQKLFGWRPKLPCVSEHKRNLSAYLDGELDATARARVEKHLAACPRCRAEYEQLRFASRVMSHFVLPEAHIPAWRVDQRVFETQSQPGAVLRRFWTMKVSIPAPAVAAVAVASIIVAAVSFTSRPHQLQTPAPPVSAGAPAPPAKIIEVPIEREVVRERVVTRVVYARGPRPPGTMQSGALANKPQRATLVAERAAVERGAANTADSLFTPASLTGFRPATNATLRIVKEPEQ